MANKTRRLALACLLSIAIGLLPACLAESGGGERVPERTAGDLATIRAEAGLPTPTATAPPPTATATATISPPTATATSEAGGPPESDPRLVPALLTRDDLGSSWTTGRDDGLLVATFCGAEPIEETFETFGMAYGSLSAAGGEWIEQWIVELDTGDAEAALEHARSEMTCSDDVTTPNDDDTLYWEFRNFPATEIGDDVFARSFDITYANPVYTPLTGSVVFVRDGDMIVIVLHYGFAASPFVSERIARIAIQKLSESQAPGV